jgi:hypothetical protein
LSFSPVSHPAAALLVDHAQSVVYPAFQSQIGLYSACLLAVLRKSLGVAPAAAVAAVCPATEDVDQVLVDYCSATRCLLEAPVDYS